MKHSARYSKGTDSAAAHNRTVRFDETQNIESGDREHEGEPVDQEVEGINTSSCMA